MLLFKYLLKMYMKFNKIDPNNHLIKIVKTCPRFIHNFSFDEIH